MLNSRNTRIKLWRSDRVQNRVHIKLFIYSITHYIFNSSSYLNILSYTHPFIDVYTYICKSDPTELSSQ